MTASHDTCALALVDVETLPTPPELAPGGDADPDRPHRWRDHDDDSREEDTL